jgi:4'-phosphopantetheinyl transferase
LAPLQILGVHVYLLSLDKAPADPGRLDGFLDDADRAKAATFRRSEQRRRFMIGRAALRGLLSFHSDEPVSETVWRFDRSENGKPFVRSCGASPPCFNLSYSAGLIAIAIADGIEIGIDIEVGQSFPSHEIPWHLFSEAEQEQLRATGAETFWAAFMRLWTLKEAIAKRMGTGFATEFSEIDTTVLSVIDGLDRIPSEAQPSPALCHVRLALPGGAVHLSVSTAPRD